MTKNDQKRDMITDKFVGVDAQGKTNVEPPQKLAELPPISTNEPLRTCMLNGLTYLIPDRKMTGDELHTRLQVLCGRRFDNLMMLTRHEGAQLLQRINPEARIGSTFAEPGTFQPSFPMTFYTLESYA